MKTTAVISGRSPPDPVPRNGSNAHRHGPRRPAPGQPARTVSRARRGAATPCGSAAPGVARCEIRRTCGRRSGLFHVARAARPTPACAPRSPGAATERRPILTEATHRCRLSAPTRRLEGRQLSTPAQGTRRGSDQTVFDKFSDQARHVVVLASDAARTHHHNHLGEHLLTGIHAAGGPTGATLGNHRPPPRHRSRRDPRLPEHRPRMCRSPLHPDPEKDPRPKPAGSLPTRTRHHRHRTPPTPRVDPHTPATFLWSAAVPDRGAAPAGGRRTEPAGGGHADVRVACAPPHSTR